MKVAAAPTTIDEYITLYPSEVQVKLRSLRNTILAAAPGAKEKIGYGIPTFTLNGNLVHFGAFTNHIGFFPGPSAIEAYAKQLEGYKTAKGTIQFPHSQQLPLELITKIVEYRVTENSRKL